MPLTASERAERPPGYRRSARRLRDPERRRLTLLAATRLEVAAALLVIDELGRRCEQLEEVIGDALPVMRIRSTTTSTITAASVRIIEPYGSPTLAVPPPMMTIGRCPACCTRRSSMIEARLPTWSEGAVGSNPTYAVITSSQASLSKATGSVT